MAVRPIVNEPQFEQKISPGFSLTYACVTKRRRTSWLYFRVWICKPVTGCCVTVFLYKCWYLQIVCMQMLWSYQRSIIGRSFICPLCIDRYNIIMMVIMFSLYIYAFAIYWCSKMDACILHGLRVLHVYWYLIFESVKTTDRQFDNFVDTSGTVSCQLQWQLPVPSVATKLPNWRSFVFSDGSL